MDKSVLLGRRASAKVQEVTLDEGVVIKVRALTRGEVGTVREIEDLDMQDRMIVCMAMLDPILTPADVKDWFDSAEAGDSVKTLEAIRALSGLAEGARKSPDAAAE
jgi:hypothetical protein